MKKNKKAFRYSVNSSVIVVGAIIITLLLNAILITLNDRFALEIDFTEDGIYELTDASKELLDKLTEDVKILMFTNGTESESVTMTRNVLSKYMQHSSKITVEEVDLIEHPTDVAAYQDVIDRERFTLASLVLTDGTRSEFISSQNFFTTEGQSNVERSVTSKLVNFVDGMSLSDITYTTGHGETSAESAQSVLETNAYNTVTLDTLMEDFPEDQSSLVVINAPQNDFSPEEIDKLDQYLDRGGSVIIQFDPAIQNTLERLEGYLSDDWGIVRKNNIVLDQGRMISGSTLSQVEFAEHEITAPLVDGQKRVVTSLSNSFEIRGELPPSVSVDVVLKSSPAATETDVASLDDGAEMPNAATGEFNLMLAATRDNYSMSENTTNTGHLIVCGSEATFDAMMLQAQFANEEVFLNAINWMKGTDSGISVRAKQMPGGTLTITLAHFWVWFVILIVVVPLGLLVAGLVIWMRRRFK